MEYRGKRLKSAIHTLRWRGKNNGLCITDKDTSHKNVDIDLSAC